MLYMKSSELKNLGIDAAEVFKQLNEEAYLRELSGNWHRGIWCYACSFTLDEVFYIEDAEPNFHSPVGSVLRIAPARPPRVSRKVKIKPTIYDYDVPF